MISVSNTKSPSNWLDKLRSSRGFQTGDEPDLNRFLSSSSSTSGSAPATESTQSESTQCLPPATSSDRRRDGEQWIGRVSDVLRDLFNMESEEGGSRSLLRNRKGSRKQRNPRFIDGAELCSSDDLRRDKSDNGLASSGDNSLNDKRENKNQSNNNDSNCNRDKFGGDDLIYGVEERENGVDLKEYSRSDVLVIDTSLKDWKFDGWVYRKDSEWIVKEKKSKSRVFGGKKRKLVLNNLNGDESKKNDNEESCLLLNKGQSQNDKKEKPLKEVTDLLGKVPQKRFPCPRPPDKPRNGGSSVILLKSIPVSNTDIVTKLGKSSLKKRPKKMKII